MVEPIQAFGQLAKAGIAPGWGWSDSCSSPQLLFLAQFAPHWSLAMKMTAFRILLVLAPLVLWMVSRVPMEGVAVADERITGRDVFLQNCALCHVSGIAMAPRIDNRQEWETRLSLGRPALKNSVLRGKGGMPPKGGNASISDTQAVAALDYMVGRVLKSEQDAQLAEK